MHVIHVFFMIQANHIDSCDSDDSSDSLVLGYSLAVEVLRDTCYPVNEEDFGKQDFKDELRF